MKNIERFNLYTAYIFGKLYDEFPVGPVSAAFQRTYLSSPVMRAGPCLVTYHYMLVNAAAWDLYF